MAVSLTLAALDSPGAFVTAEEFEDRFVSEERGGERFELLGGVVYLKVGQGRIHSDALSLVFRAFNNLPPHLSIASQSTIRIDESNVPEPDFALVERDPKTASRRTTATDLRLVIEIAVSSLRTDRLVKARLYAEVGVPEYWIVNPHARQIEIYLEPKGGVYTLLRVALAGETIVPQATERSISVDDLMPVLGGDD